MKLHLLLVSIFLLCTKCLSMCDINSPRPGEEIQWSELQGQWYSVLTTSYENEYQCVRLQNFQRYKKDGFRVGAEVMTLNEIDGTISTSKKSLRYNQAHFGVYENFIGKTVLKKAGGKDLRQTLTYRTDYENYIIAISCTATGQSVTVYTQGRHPSSRNFEVIQTKLHEENITETLYLSACPMLHEIPML